MVREMSSGVLISGSGFQNLNIWVSVWMALGSKRLRVRLFFFSLLLRVGLEISVFLIIPFVFRSDGGQFNGRGGADFVQSWRGREVGETRRAVDVC